MSLNDPTTLFILGLQGFIVSLASAVGLALGIKKLFFSPPKPPPAEEFAKLFHVQAIEADVRRHSDKFGEIENEVGGQMKGLSASVKELDAYTHDQVHTMNDKLHAVTVEQARVREILIAVKEVADKMSTRQLEADRKLERIGTSLDILINRKFPTDAPG